MWPALQPAGAVGDRPARARSSIRRLKSTRGHERRRSPQGGRRRLARAGLSRRGQGLHRAARVAAIAPRRSSSRFCPSSGGSRPSRWPKPAIEAVENGKTKFVPELWTKTYMHWMTNIKDWCISRQLWWGHRIPAWYCDGCGELMVSRQDPSACKECGSSDIFAKMTMSSTPGFRRACGRFRPWAGPRRPRLWPRSIPTRSWSPAPISFSSGSPA